MKSIDEMTMEEAFDSLKSLLDKMESEDHTLEENFEMYEQGLGLVKVCGAKLDDIEKKIIVLEEKEPDGTKED